MPVTVGDAGPATVTSAAVKVDRSIGSEKVTFRSATAPLESVGE